MLYNLYNFYIFIYICVIYLFLYHIFLSYSYDDEDLNISDDFKYIYKICLLALQHAEINIDTIKVVKNLSASILNICHDSMY